MLSRELIKKEEKKNKKKKGGKKTTTTSETSSWKLYPDITGKEPKVHFRFFPCYVHFRSFYNTT